MLKNATLLSLSLILFTHASPQQKIPPENLHAYVHHYVSGLFGSYRPQQEQVNDIAHVIAQYVQQDAGKWSWYDWTYQYDLETVQEHINAHVITYIEDQVRHIAWNYTHDRETIELLVHHFSDEASRIFTQYGHLNGRFRAFLHDTLAQQVWRKKEQLDKERKVQKVRMYPSEECCVCMEHFNNVQRIFLKPCGHDICAECAYQLYFGYKQVTCSLCRAKIDMADLRAKLHI